MTWLSGPFYKYILLQQTSRTDEEMKAKLASYVKCPASKRSL